jgi:hypothetical protein
MSIFPAPLLSRDERGSHYGAAVTSLIAALSRRGVDTGEKILRGAKSADIPIEPPPRCRARM